MSDILDNIVDKLVKNTQSSQEKDAKIAELEKQVAELTNNNTKVPTADASSSASGTFPNETGGASELSSTPTEDQVPVQAPPVSPPAREVQVGLTRETIAQMSEDQINKNWDQIKEVLAT